MEKEIFFEIIKKKNNYFSYLYDIPSYLGIILFISYLITLIVYKDVAIIRQLLVLFALIGLIQSQWMLPYLYENIGLLKFSASGIEIELKESREMNFENTRLKKCVVNYDNYRHWVTLAAFVRVSGTKNYISFEFNETNHTYYFLSKHKNDRFLIKQILQIWYKQNIEFEYFELSKNVNFMK